MAMEASPEPLGAPFWQPVRSYGPTRSQGSSLNLGLGRSLLFVLLAFGLVGARPFSGADIDCASTSSDGMVNQAVWLGAVAVAIPLIFSRYRLILSLIGRTWPLLLVIAWDTATAAWSPVPGITIRRVAVLWFMYVAALGVAASGVPLRDFHRIAFIVSGLVMAIDIMTAVGMPSRGLDNEGRLIGMHGHKNTAGQIAVMARLCWYYYAGRYQWRTVRLLVLGCAGIFYLTILATGSKTGTALAMVVIVWTMMVVMLARKGSSIEAIFSSGVVFAVLGLVIVLMLSGVSWTEVGTAVFGDLTFTGRLPLWEVIWDKIQLNFWNGYGFGAFWDVAGSDNSLGLSKSVGWLGVVGQAHNGYLDLFLQTGAIGLGLAVLSLGWIFHLAARLLAQPTHHSGDMPARAFGYAMVLSIALYNLLESSYLRPHHMQAIWLFLLVGLMQRDLLLDRLGKKAGRAPKPPPLQPVRREPFLSHQGL
jgi:O-antigen ligase